MPLSPEVLAAFRLEGCEVRLAARRENHVYQVGDWALRAHRPGYRTLNQIAAELAFMQALQSAGCNVPTPGQIHEIEGHIYSTISWLDGQTFADLGQVPLPAFEALGALLKKCHQVALPDLDRPIWDVEAMLGEHPLWGRWQDHPDLKPEQLALFKALSPKPDLPPLQLIHADALRENVMLVQGQPYLIDFDDCAFSYPSFDVATVLVKEWQNPEFDAIQEAVLVGYGDMDPKELSFMMALRALTYVGWVKDRLQEPGVADRSQSMIARAEHFVRAYVEAA